MIFIILAGIILTILLAAYVLKLSDWRGPRRIWSKVSFVVTAETTFSVLAMVLLGAPRPAVAAVSAVALAGCMAQAALEVLGWWRSSRRRRREKAEEAPEVLPVDEDLFNRCCSYMEHKKPFLVEALTLSDLASAMFTNTLYLSRTINACSGKNFRRFVNDYRVDYAMGLFRKNMSLKVSELSEMSGFHTVVTFNMAFKLVKGVTPSIWCQAERFRAGNASGRAT